MVANQSDQTSKLKKEITEKEAAAVTERGKTNDELNKIQEIRIQLDNVKKGIEDLERNRGASGVPGAAIMPGKEF